jgi:hypothetical protein
MLKAEAPDQQTQQAGLLAFGSSRFLNRLPADHSRRNLCSGIEGSEAWPITAAAPQRFCTVFPILSASPFGARRTCRYESMNIVPS